MRKRSISLLLILTLILAAGVLAQDYRFDNSIAAERDYALDLERRFGTLSRSLAALRTAQAGYVAAGQGLDFWTAQATDLAGGISAAIADLRDRSTVAAAAPRYHAAELALAELTREDAKARDLVRTEDRLSASDAIFVDALQKSQALEAELAAARTAELADSERRAAQLAQLRLAMNAAAFLGLTVLVFTLRPASAAPAPAAAPSEQKGKLSPTTLQMLRDLPPPVKNGQPAVITPPVAPVVVQPAIKPAMLTAAAELCVDLARVMDGRDLPALIQRAVNVLEAKGIVLWVADTAGAQLRPSMTHGYSEKVVARLGPLQVDGDNVTSLAFRSMQPQVVPGSSPAEPGALAVPLITPSGCVGVLAAETRANRNGQDLLPLARIIAAQLASIVAPVDVVPDVKVAGAT
jgi:hypothetical protein